MRRLMPYLKNHTGKIILAIVLLVLTSVFGALSPKLEGMITTSLFEDINAKLGVNFVRIYKIIGALLITYIGGALFQWIYQFLLTDAIQESMASLRQDILKKINKMPVSYFDENPLGDTLSRVTNDVETISNALQQGFAQIVNAFLGLTLALVMMIQINRKLLLIGISIIVLAALISFLIARKSQVLFHRQQDALGHLNGVVQERYTGFNEIKLFGKEEETVEIFKAANNDLCQNGFKAQFISGLMDPLVSLITYIGIGITIFLGGFMVLNGQLAVGDLQAFIRYIWQINVPMSQVTKLSATIQSSIAATKRVFEFLDETEETESQEGVLPFEGIKGDVCLENISFRYEKDQPLLNQISAEIKSGEMVAIVGPTGVGKTTLINLLMRFYEIDEGKIRIDGVDIKTLTRDQVRAMFGMVLQDTWLFNGTIKENIAYGCDNVTEEEIINAAKVANIHTLIESFPQGYDTIINEEGNNISQGEKQLLTIARTILVNPPMLILDEATSSVDTRLERLLQEAMNRLMKGRTSFVIAHRLSTIKNADLILVMQDGDIVEQGKHSELMERGGYYHQLYNAQFEN